MPYGNKTFNENYCKIPYLYVFHSVSIFVTTTISEHLLPFAFYYLKIKTGDYFNEWNNISLSGIYDMTKEAHKRNVNQSMIHTSFSDHYRKNYNAYESSMKQTEYSDPFPGNYLNYIFGYGGLCHLNEQSIDIKFNPANNLFIRCIIVYKIKSLYFLLVYWALINSLFIASTIKE